MAETENISTEESSTAVSRAQDKDKVAIRIGGTLYNIDVSKIPYLAGFVRFQKTAQPEATEFIHSRIAHFDVALEGIESGYRHCFRSMPSDLSQYHSLFDTYDFLNIDVLCGLPHRVIIDNIKPEPSLDITWKTSARDAAFQLLFLITRIPVRREAAFGRDLFNVVLYVVSHGNIYSCRTRRIMRTAYEERFGLSNKQRKGLERWEREEEGTDDETDVTTEEGFR